MDEVGRAQLHEEGGYDIAKEHDALGDSWTDKIEGSGENDDIEDIVNET